MMPKVPFKGLVSVVIPAYNCERWVREAIESCLDQSYTSIEIVVVNDGSTDGTLDVLRSFGDRIVLEDGPNRGACAARNRGLQLARGEWIQHLDGDDFLLPNKIERQLERAQKTGADVVYSDWHWQHHPGGGAGVRGKLEVSGAQKDVTEALLGGWWVATAALLYRSEVITRIGGWDSATEPADDFDLFLRAAESGAQIEYEPMAASIYRNWGDVTLARGNWVRYVRGHAFTLDKHRQLLIESEGLSPAYARSLSRNYFGLARQMFAINRAEARRLVAQTQELWPEFEPQVNPFYRFLFRKAGFTAAEKLALLTRRARRLIGPGS